MTFFSSSSSVGGGGGCVVVASTSAMASESIFEVGEGEEGGCSLIGEVESPVFFCPSSWPL